MVIFLFEILSALFKFLSNIGRQVHRNERDQLLRAPCLFIFVCKNLKTTFTILKTSVLAKNLYSFIHPSPSDVILNLVFGCSYM